MVNRIIAKGKKVFTDPQSSVLSAATVIMLMIVASRVLGLVRQRTLAHFFQPEELSLFFAAFRLPDLVFEILVFGTFSAAFIPVFAKSVRGGKKKAWETAGIIVNLGLIAFVIFSTVLIIGSKNLYSVIAPGYGTGDTERIAEIATILFAAQGFFVVSYVLTGVLESLKRFLVPALAPLFYNLGIILGTIFLAPKMGLLAPAVGVVFGAFSHFIIQLPLAIKIGFRFNLSLKITEDVKKIGRLALPRMLEVSILQISKVAELFFSSLVSTASYTYYTFGNTLQLLPVGLFGTSIAKAALPTLASRVNEPERFKKTLFSALYDMAFFVIPTATLLVVLRVPIVRLVYGTDLFSWEATIQTGYVLSAFAVGIFFQAASALIARSFYAMHDTKTPLVISMFSVALILLFDFVFINYLGFDVWGLAASFSIGSAFQATSLFFLVNKRINGNKFLAATRPLLKFVLSSFVSGSVMFFLLKIFDRSVWVKRLSFLGKIEATRQLPFESFVLDTRYTANLLVLTILVSLVGAFVYLVISIFLRTQQVWTFFNLARRIFIKHKVDPIPDKETEPVSPTPTDTAP